MMSNNGYSQYAAPTPITVYQKLLLDEVIYSGWLAGDPNQEIGYIGKLREKIANFTGYRHVVLCSNGTTALEAAVLATDARGMLGNALSGNCAYVSGNTFVATVLSVINHTDKRVAIAHTDDKTFNATKEEWVDIRVSYAGLPDTEKCIILDSAHGLFANMSDVVQAKVVTASFHAIKPLSCGEGGAILTNDSNIANFCLNWVSHGRYKSSVSKQIGTNARMPNMMAALGYGSICTYQERMLNRQGLASLYRERLADCPVQPQDDSPNHTYHLFPIACSTPSETENLRKYLQRKGIGVSDNYMPQEWHPSLLNSDLFYTDKIALDIHTWNKSNLQERLLCLPMHDSLTKDDVSFVSSCIREYYKHK